ncbi:MAG TPA: hypothetical protein VHM70_15720 [Polyangiaceae bacterium]|nr:hypothetical protein [Polyangiaceae bacterium]
MRYEAIAMVLVAIIGTSTNSFAREREWHVGGSAGAELDPAHEVAPLLGLQAGYGVLDAVDARAEVFGAYRPKHPHVDLGALLGLNLKFDVTRWVPFVGVAVGAQSALDASELAALIVPAVGVDYLVSRDWSWGLEYRPALLLSAAPLELEHQCLLRLEKRWGW